MTNEEKHIKIKEMLADPVQRQAILEAMAKGTEKRCQSEPHTVIDPKTRVKQTAGSWLQRAKHLHPRSRLTSD